MHAKTTTKSPPSKNLLHQTFNRLTAIGIAGRKGKQVRWLWRCSCGTLTIAFAANVTRGHTKSCGCWHRDATSIAKTTHGATVGRVIAREYTTWQSMLGRCYNPKNAKYPRYGGRGIEVCERWRHSFKNFLTDMGKKPAGLTLDRIDNDKGYSPDNCRWATRARQNRNYSRNVMLTFQGETMCLTDWASHKNLTSSALLTRLRRGWSVERALATPPLVNQYG